MENKTTNVTANLFGVLFWVLVFTAIVFFVLSDEVSKVVDQGIVAPGDVQPPGFPPGGPQAFCGDDVCGAGEDFSTCALDCPPEGGFCGDDVCASDENPLACPADCVGEGSICGDDVCENGETDSNCPADCMEPSVCGDGVCNLGENTSSCPVDCPPGGGGGGGGGGGPPGGDVCGDNICGGTETCGSCEPDCGVCPPPGPYCGDDICNNNETCASCSEDCGVCPPGTSCSDVGGVCLESCGPSYERFEGGDNQCSPLICCVQKIDVPGEYCGDKVCNNNETCESCERDCGACPPPPPSCGDNVCDNGESCSSCEEDCGACPPPGSNYFFDDYDNTNYIEELIDARQVASYIEPTGVSGGGEIDPQGALGPGLLALWHFNDNVRGNGQIVRDSKGTRNGTLVADADCTVAGNFNGGCKLDGTGDHIDLGADGDLVEGLGAFTVSLWAKNTNSDVTTTGWYLDKTGSGSDTFELFIGGTERVNFRVYNSSGSAVTAGNNVQAEIKDTSWHNLVGVYDGTRVKLYIDGSLNPNSPSLSGVTSSTANNLNIGARSAGTAGFFNGTLDETAFWNRALSDQEIASLSQQPRVSGFFRSTTITALSDFYSLKVQWLENGSAVGLEASTDGGTTWCPMENGGNLTDGRCVLPAQSFKYRVNFDGATRMQNVRFDWETEQPVCGNNRREGNEVCDGTDLGGETCESRGYQSGTLLCKNDCSDYDMSQCVPFPPPPPGVLFADWQLAQNCINGDYSIGGHNCSGSDGDAYMHPQLAAEVVEPGDTVMIRGGTYRTHARSNNGKNVMWVKRPGLLNSRIRFQNYTGENVVFDNTGSTEAVIQIGDRFVQGLGSFVEIVGLKIKGGTKQGIYVRKSSYVLIENNEVYETTGSADQGGGIFISEAELVHGYHTIRKNHVHHNNNGIIVKPGPYSIIEYNYSHHNVDPQQPGNSDGIVAAGDNITTRFNVVHDNSDDGLDIGMGSFFGWERGPYFNIVEHNVAYNNGCVDGYCGDGSGIKLNTYDPLIDAPGGAFVVRYNLVFNNRGRGLEDAGNYRSGDPLPSPSVHYGNIVFNNGINGAEADGYYHESNDVILLNNISHNTTNDPDFWDTRSKSANNGYFRDVYSNYNLWGNRWVKEGQQGNENFLGDGLPPGEPLWWDQQSIDCGQSNCDQVFVDPDNPGVVTDLSRPDFGDAPGFHFRPGSPAIDKGVNVRQELITLLAEIQSTNERGVDVANWVLAINFALQNIPNPFPYNGKAPDIGGIYENR